MATPKDVSYHHIVSLQISRGPSLHSIEHVLCSPRNDWHLLGVVFELAVPFNEKASGQCWESNIHLHFTPVALQRFDTDRFTLGCWLTADLQNGNVDYLFKAPPFKVANYSTKSRVGNMEVCKTDYLRFVQMLTDRGL